MRKTAESLFKLDFYCTAFSSMSWAIVYFDPFVVCLYIVYVLTKRSHFFPYLRGLSILKPQEFFSI